MLAFYSTVLCRLVIFTQQGIAENVMLFQDLNRSNITQEISMMQAINSRLQFSCVVLITIA